MGVEGLPEKNDLGGASGTVGMSCAHLSSIGASAACTGTGRTRRRKRPPDNASAAEAATMRRLQTRMAQLLFCFSI
jgi:hypothetical protein